MGSWSDEREDHPRAKRTRSWGWFPVVVVSAMVGSGTTLTMIPVLKNITQMAAAFAPSSPVLSDTSTVAPVTQTVHVNVADGVVQAVRQVKPAVMGVVNYGQVGDFFTQQTKLEATGVGTGVLYYKDGQSGYIVTNNHVVAGAAKVEIVLAAGKHIHATVVGTDPYTDLAVLKIPIYYIKHIAPARFANSDNIQVGEPAIAIGTPMGLDFADSVTAGIISAKKRIMPVETEGSQQQVLDYQAVIQTDAAINPGNSGGPLLNIQGDVIGINSSKIAAPNFEGMGFAIPSNEVRAIANQIMDKGFALHPALGIQGYSLAAIAEQWWPDVPVDYGVYVYKVTQDASTAGLHAQDVIVSIDGQGVKSMADLRTYLFEKKPGEIVKLDVYRGSHRLTLSVRLNQMSTADTAQASPSDTVGQLTPYSVPGWNGN